VRSNTSTVTYKTNAEKAGKLGEEIVAEKMGIKLSEDKFDSEKDGLRGKKSAEISTEIKTLRLNNFTQTLWIQKNQWRKCDNVDELIWNEVPENPNDPMITYQIDNKNKKAYYNKTTNKGERVRCYYKNMMTPLFDTKDERTVKIHDLSVVMSKWGRFK
jgi:hypothetical protein